MAHDPWLNNFTTGNAFDWRLVMDDPKAAYIEWIAINNAAFGCGMHNDLDVWFAAINFADTESDKRISELEAQLKTAKRDGVLDFAKSTEFTEIFDNRFSASIAAIAAYNYANSLTGEES